MHSVRDSAKELRSQNSGCFGGQLFRTKKMQSQYPLVNDHIAIAGISPFSIGNTNRLNPGPPFSAKPLC